MSHRFGWCMDGHHGDCPHEVFRLKSMDGKVITTTDISTCECPCHSGD